MHVGISLSVCRIPVRQKCTLSVRSLWFCCIGFSVCNFTRLMTLSHTCEASLTKIQQHNVHSIFVSFLPIQKAFQSALGHLESLLVLATVQRRCQCWRGGMFLPNRWKSITVLHTHRHTYFHLVISRPALTFSHSLQSELMCQSCSFPLKTDVAGTSN